MVIVVPVFGASRVIEIQVGSVRRKTLANTGIEGWINISRLPRHPGRYRIIRGRVLPNALLVLPTISQIPPMRLRTTIELGVGAKEREALG
jgi:hypothetical protein